MKLSSILLIATLLNVSAAVYSQDVKISIHAENMTMEHLFAEIERQTDVKFLYRYENVSNMTVSMNVVNQPLSTVLNRVLSDKGLKYNLMEGNLIVIVPTESRQGITVTGTVTDASGTSMPGVNVVVKGTNSGTVTDASGRYSITVSDGETELSFSFVGYVTKGIVVGSQTVIDVSLSEDSQQLDEVVVIGYGTQKKKDLSGAVAAIGGEQLAARKTTQVSMALQGAMSGVQVTRDNNAPGASATIRVRGTTTIGNSDPLIIVDGMQVDNINDINPNDIESLSVLKDAASSSIYGSQAAAGVILVTTKRAQADRFNLEYNFEYGMEIPTQTPEYVDVQRYMQLVNELRWNDAGNGPNEYPNYTKDVIDNYMKLNADDPDNYPNTDWQSLMYKSFAPRQSHLVRLTGGSKMIRTAASFGYDKVGAIYDNRNYQRLTARVNNDIKINRFLAASLDINMKRTIEELASIDPIYTTRFSSPVYAAKWKDGRFAEGKTGNNIYAQVEAGGYDHNYYNQLGAKAQLDFTPLAGLKVSGIVAPVFNSTKKKIWRKAVPLYAADDPTKFVTFTQWGSETKLSEERNDSYRITSQVLATYDKTFGGHSVNVMAGYEDRYEFNENERASRGKYALDSYPYLDLGPLELRDNSGNADEYARQSYFGRIMYNYRNRYYLQANIRRDASSRFASEYRWGTFPSVSAAWVLTGENFMQKQNIFDFLKLRFSYGSLGNERIGNYPYQAAILFSNGYFVQNGSVVAQQGAAQQRYAIRDISWETTKSYDIGLDAWFLDSRLRFTGDFYKKETSGMLLALQIPSYLGYDNPDQNTGKMHTTGWEIELGWNDRIGELAYSVSFNLSDYKSVMGDLGGTEFLGDQIKIQGSEFNEWYGYRANGLFQTQEEVDAAAKISASVKPGDVHFVDISGPDGTPDGVINGDYDKVLLGGSQPRYTYGGNIQLNYRGIDFGIVVQGVGKRNARVETLWVQPLFENWGNFPAIIDGNSFSHYNTAEQNLSARYPRYTYSNPGSNYTMSDFWLFNGRYFRLKNVSLGYTLPQKWVNAITLHSARLYVSASDLFCLNKYPKGWDPENGASAYPITTSLIFGVSVKF